MAAVNRQGAIVKQIRYLMEQQVSDTNDFARKEGPMLTRDRHQKPIEVENIVMHQHSASVAHNLPERAKEHGEEKGPCSVADSEERLSDEDDGESCEEEGIGTQGRDIFERRIVFRTGVQGAERRVVPRGDVESRRFAGEGKVLRI